MQVPVTNMSDSDDSSRHPSLKQIQQKNLVQRRTQLFEQGINHDSESEGRREGASNAGPVSPQAESRSPSKNLLPTVKLQPPLTKLDNEQTGSAKQSPPSPEPSSSIAERAKVFGQGGTAAGGSGTLKPRVLSKPKPVSTSEDATMMSKTSAGYAQVQKHKKKFGEVKSHGVVDSNTKTTKDEKEQRWVSDASASNHDAFEDAAVMSKTVAGYAQVQQHMKKKLGDIKTHDAVGSNAKANKDRKEQSWVSDTSVSNHAGFIILPKLSPKVNSQDVDCSVRMNLKSQSKPIPPKKPPRTFAHDEYVEAKMKEKTAKQQVTANKGNTYEEVELPSNPGYEEVNVQILTQNCRNGPCYEDVDIGISNQCNEDNTDSEHHLYDEVSPSQAQPAAEPPLLTPNRSGAKGHRPATRLPSSKLPPPPKPPLPTAGGGVSSRFDSPVVKVTKHNDRLDQDSFAGKKGIANPSYSQQHEILQIEMRGRMKRSCSDEYLYVDQTRAMVGFVSPSCNPVYQEPVDAVGTPEMATVTKHGVVLDSEGYAQPVVRHSRVSRLNSDGSSQHHSRQQKGTLGAHHGPRPCHFMAASHSHFKARPTMVTDKVSQAYSVLRLAGELSDTSAGQDGTTVHCIPEDLDRDNEVDMDEHKKRLEHLCTVKLRLQKGMKNRPKSFCMGRAQRLFDFAMVVGLEYSPDKNQYVPKVLFHFPQQEGAEDNNNIAQFCFPDASQWRPVTHYTHETFSFVLTDADGSKRHGYCKRMLPPGRGNRLPEVLCVVSSLGSWQFYESLLMKLEERRKEGLDRATELMQAAFGKPLPQPGMEAWIRSMDVSGERETISIRRASNPRLEGVSHSLLLKFLKTETLLKVFASILLERQLIFVAQHLSTLSTCIHAIVSLLYPFTWQHTFVPILPESILEVCCSPTPYILGVLTSCLPELGKLTLKEVLIIDLDHSNLVQSQGDESRIIPMKLQKALTSALRDDTETREQRNLLISEAFLRLFVETVGHYTEYISEQQDGLSIFQREMFVRAVSTKSIRLFLEWFTETQMFEVFMTEKLENPTEGLFEERILEYREEMLKASPTTVKQNMKDVGKKMHSFLTDFGGKLKRALGRGNVYV